MAHLMPPKSLFQSSFRDFVTVTLTNYLAKARAREASDLHLAADTVPFLRVEGELVRLDEAPLDAAEVAAVLMGLAPEPSRQALQKGANTEWTCDVAEVGRIRCMSFHDHRGQGGIFGMLPARALSRAWKWHASSRVQRTAALRPQSRRGSMR